MSLAYNHFFFLLKEGCFSCFRKIFNLISIRFLQTIKGLFEALLSFDSINILITIYNHICLPFPMLSIRLFTSNLFSSTLL